MTRADVKYNDERRKRYAENPEVKKAASREQARAINRRWRAENPDGVKRSVRKAQLKSRYGLTPEKWQTLFESQGRSCAVCLVTEPGSKRGWHTDHCHDTKTVRGILCIRCNLMLGHIKDGELLQAALHYLKRPMFA